MSTYKFPNLPEVEMRVRLEIKVDREDKEELVGAPRQNPELLFDRGRDQGARREDTGAAHKVKFSRVCLYWAYQPSGIARMQKSTRLLGWFGISTATDSWDWSRFTLDSDAQDQNAFAFLRTYFPQVEKGTQISS